MLRVRIRTTNLQQVERRAGELAFSLLDDFDFGDFVPAVIEND